MKTPINQKIIDSTKLSLFHSNENENFQLNIIKLANKCCLFTCEQVSLLMNEIKNREFKIPMITLLYPNVIDKENFQIINNTLESQSEKNLLDQLIKKNYNVEKGKSQKNKSIPNFKINEISFSELKNNSNFYIEQLKTENSYALNSQDNEVLISNQNLNTESKLNKTTNYILESDISYKNLLVSNDRLAKFIKSKSFKEEINFKKKLSQLRSFLNNNYISINQSVKIISFFATEENTAKEFVLGVYPCIYDPQNIEDLVRKIEAVEVQDALRVKLFCMPNFHFEIYEANAGQSNCCCVVF